MRTMRRGQDRHCPRHRSMQPFYWTAIVLSFFVSAFVLGT